jgi:phosphoglycerol transferase MdoB-like AlkP superfamily enzyme
VIRLAFGLAATVFAWAISRTVAGAWRSGRAWGWAFDLAIPLAMFAGLLGVSDKPLFAGVTTFALIGGFAFADFGKRAVLREPVVFTDLSELVELVRHPHLYLPFVGPAKVVAGALGAAAAFLALLWLEPTLWPFSWPIAGLAAASSAALVFGSATVTLQPVGRFLSRFKVSGDPVADSAALGALAMQFAYGVPTRAGRAAIRAAGGPGLPLILPKGRAPDIVLVQSESFFDARRLHGGIPRNLLPGFDALKASGTQWGEFGVPTWGASTTRTEFAVMSGRSADTIGLDRFNPYHALALRPLISLASRLRAAGYRTVCVHPHDRNFYGRNRVMPCLGFDEFLGLEAFSGAERSGRYVRDVEAGRLAAGLIAASSRPIFVFIITMENHGPWTPRDGEDEALASVVADDLAVPGLGRYLAGLRGGDAIIPPLVEALTRRGEGVLGFYGDHMPSLPFAAEAGQNSDYAIWRAGGRAKPAHRPIEAHELGERLLQVAGLRPN